MLQIKLACVDLRDLRDEMRFDGPSAGDVQSGCVYCRRCFSRRCRLCIRVASMVRDAPMSSKQVTSCKRLSASTRVRLLSSIYADISSDDALIVESLS